jgi:hypothetical protein
MPLLGVANKMFTPVGGGPRPGEISGTAAFSAKEIYNAGIKTNGNYWVKGTGSTPRLVYCLMDRRGGGWTRVMRIQRNFDGSTRNFYTADIGSSFDSSVTTTFNLAPALFGNANGTDLSIMYRVVGSGGPAGSTFPGSMGGAIWKGYYLTEAWDMAKDIGTITNNGTPQYSVDGVTFTNFTGDPLGKANNQWNLVHGNFTSGIGNYAYAGQESGFILGHGGSLGNNFLQQNYGWIEGHGSVGGEDTWSYVDVYIRKDG